MSSHSHSLPGSRSIESGILPSPQLDDLLHYAKVSDTKQRDQIEFHVAVILSMDHVGKLLAIFEQCAQQNDLSNMRTLRGIFYTMLLWAHTDMIQELVLDKHIHGVLGVFDFMSKRNVSFREQFETMPRLDLIDPLKKNTKLVENLRQSENLVFIKTHITPQLRQTALLVSALNRMCSWKHLAIVNWTQQDTLMIPPLFRLLKTSSDNMVTDQERWGLQFLSMVFEFAWKDMQDFASRSFVRELANKGLLDVIEHLLCMDDKEIHTTATHLLYTTAQMDVRVLQHYILAQNEKHHHQQSGLLKVILDQLVRVNDYELKQQLFDIVKRILGLGDTSEQLSSYTRQNIFDERPDTGNILKLFYERYASTLISPIYDIQTPHEHQQSSSSSSTMMEEDVLEQPLEMDRQQILFYGSLCEFLQSNLLQYGARTKRILQEPGRLCFQHMAQLLRCPDPSLRLGTIGFFRALIGLRDTDINTSLIQQNVFVYLVQLLLDRHLQQQQKQQEQQHHLQHANKDKIYTQLIELLEFIQQRNILPLMEHIVDKFDGLLEPIPIYQCLKAKYDKRLSTSSSYIFIR